MAEATLPEEMIVFILTWLPVKSLIRFTCVSKRFHSLILFDPKFAKSQFQAARDRNTLTRRLLHSTTAPKLESLDLETPSFGDPSSVRKLKLPHWSPVLPLRVALLGSCNGIVFLAFGEKIYYMWNPSTGFFSKLPDPVFSTSQNMLFIYGVGYLPASDDYRVFVVSTDLFDEKDEVAIFSSRAHAWKPLEVRSDVLSFVSGQGILLKEALHWVDDVQGEILAFDLGQEEKHKFRKMWVPLPDFNHDSGYNYGSHLGVSVGGYLSLARKLYVCADRIDIWVMGEYGLRDSWTKRFNLKLLDSPDDVLWNQNVLVLETGMVARILVYDMNMSMGCGLVMIDQKEEDKCSIYEVEGDWFTMIQYQESLLRIDD